MYKCICGKEFDNSQSFNAHKSHCKEHQMNKYGSLDKMNQKQVKISEKCSKTLKQKFLSKKQQELDKWISEQHTCERCGKIMTEKYGSGRFCCKSCANSKKHSEETKQKISDGLKKNYAEHLVSVKPKEIKVCKVCGEKICPTNKSGLCIDCYLHTEEGFKIRSDISKSIRDSLRSQGKQFGFPSRNVTSFPEKFWCDVLDKNNISYKREVKILNDHNSCYFLDFLINIGDIKLDLEIDGEQHLKPNRQESDKIRDSFLSKNFIIYRVPWNEIKTPQGLDKMKNKIKDFLEFYSTLKSTI